MWKIRALAALFAAAIVGGCAASGSNDTDDEEVGETLESNLTAAQRKDRAQHLRDVSFSRGLTNGWMLAGIGNAETQLSHCWSELTWACKGPASADCGGGPVVAGAGDGPCSQKQGGLGMFQFDAGTHTQTLNKYGNKVLTVDGNIDQAITFVLNMVVNSKYITGVSTESEALQWLNAIKVGGTNYNTWIKTVTHYYNGCAPSYSCYNQRFKHYDDSTRAVYNEMGAAFWVARAPMEVYWERLDTGVYDLRALAPSNVTKVRYLVDDYEIAVAAKDNPATTEVEDNFPGNYKFKYETPERVFVALGYDKSGANVARGVGLIDSVPGMAVYIRQMGDHLYEIGLERASDDVAYVQVKADGYVLTDEDTGDTMSHRNAVKYKFQNLGERTFEIALFTVDGKPIETLVRDFKLE
ncbi:MAG: hypothetical protein IPK82_39705 [Polyangiaceae bacterium]|nr:hypothetical protein [Polyangiaceae bacterium]